MKAHQIQASILELQQRSASNLIWLKAGHADPSIDRNHEKRIAEMEAEIKAFLAELAELQQEMRGRMRSNAA